MKTATRHQIKSLVSKVITKKIKTHDSESGYRPFFEAIFNKKQVLLASLMHSFYTSFGMSLYEQIGEILAKDRGYYAERQYHLLGAIDNRTYSLITKMTNDLKRGKEGNASKEMNLIKKSIKPSKALEISNNIVDLFVKTRGGEEYYFGISTVKLNKEGIEDKKNKLLRWMAIRMSQNKNAKAHFAVVFPYNPYYPQKYHRFGTMITFDKSQLLIQEEFWDLLGGKGTFKELIGIFEEVGDELRDKIDAL